MSSVLLASFLLGLWASSWLAPGTGGSRTNPAWPANSLIDRDGDGLPDYARVGDFDHDGVLEIDDLQDAVNGLTDSGPKLIVATPGVYLPPPVGPRRVGRSHALLELGSFTTLECSGVGRTVLRGGPPTGAGNLAVVGNHDHVLGNDAVWIKNCEIDGNAPPAYASGAIQHYSQRMGVYFRRTRHSGVSDSYVHDTVHAGLYTSNSTGDQFLRNRVEDAGGYGDTTGRWRQPCIYLFAFGGGAVLSDFQAIDNTLSRCGHSGLNTRAEDADAPGDVIRNLRWERNTVAHTLSFCISLRGTESATVRNLRCRSTGPIHAVRGFGSGYRFQGNDNANSKLLIEDAVATNVEFGEAGLDIGPWVDGLTLRHVRVVGTRDGNGASLDKDCARLQRPLRNAVVEDLELRDCGGGGLVVTSIPGGLGDQSETLTLRRVRCVGTQSGVPCIE